MKLSKTFVALLTSMCIFFASSGIANALSYTDVIDKNPATEYLAALTEKGIVKGYSSSIFSPDDICTREQFISFLWRAYME